MWSVWKMRSRRKMWKRTVLFFALALTPTAFADVQYANAQVVDVEPIFERVEHVEPKERCWFETREHRVERSASTPLIGALVGGAIGHALGHKKRNKQIGTVVGAVLGGSIAHDISRREERAAPVHRVREKVCEVINNTTYRERIAGYLVTYRYGGKTHRTRMDREPGETIRVRIRVSPA